MADWPVAWWLCVGYVPQRAGAIAPATLISIGVEVESHLVQCHVGVYETQAAHLQTL